VCPEQQVVEWQIKQSSYFRFGPVVAKRIHAYRPIG
jgi:hypothetical protein